MPQADSQDITLVSSIDASGAFPSAPTAELVADKARSLLNGKAALVPEPVRKKERPMSRRNVLTTACAAAGLELAAHPAAAFAPRRARGPAHKPATACAPIPAALPAYR